MRPLLLALSLVLGTALVAAPAHAQKRDKDKVIENFSPDDADALDAAGIMRRALPFKQTQTVRYFSGDGKFEGYASRNHRTIRFYDASGTYVGRAERVTQALTNYYTPDGKFIGRRTKQKMTTANTATFELGAKGFLDLYDVKQPNQGR
jgi:hypothetical protein